MKSRLKQAIILLFTVIIIGIISIGWTYKTSTVPNEIIREAVAKSIPVLQLSCNAFIEKKHCSSCHHGTLTSMLVELAKQKGVPVEDSFATNRQMAYDGTIEAICNPNIIRHFINVKLIAPYMLLGMAAEKIAPDFKTDLAIAFIMSEANPDGSFPGEFLRAPMEVGQVYATVFNLRALQLYSSPALKPKVDQMLANTKMWLENVRPNSMQELAFQLMGLQWCGSGTEIKKEVAGRIMNFQRADGGWAQIPSLRADAYATGVALFALYESGMIQTSDEKCQQAIVFLLKSQESNGVWFVEARSYIIQPFVNTNFPINDESQFISAAASGWASIALMKSLPDKSTN